MPNLPERFDQFLIRRVDRLAWRLQADGGWHYLDLLSGSGIFLYTLMFLGVFSISGLTSLGLAAFVTLYAALGVAGWKVFLQPMRRDRRNWRVQEFIKWMQNATAFRHRPFWIMFRLGLWLCSIFLAVVPLAIMWKLGEPISPFEITRNVGRSIIHPGTILIFLYCLSVYPTPPGLWQEKKDDEAAEAAGSTLPEPSGQ